MTAYDVARLLPAIPELRALCRALTAPDVVSALNPATTLAAIADDLATTGYPV